MNKKIIIKLEENHKLKVTENSPKLIIIGETVIATTIERKGLQWK